MELTSTKPAIKKIIELYPVQPKPQSKAYLNLVERIGKEAANFISACIPENVNVKILETTTRFNIETLTGKTDCFINLKRVNDIRYLNKFFETVNLKLSFNGIFAGCVETYDQRKTRIFNKYHPLIAKPFYVIDFIYKRIFPKWVLTKKLYFFLSKGNNRVLSRAETLGRLVSCGFEILAYKDINNMMYFACRSVEGPAFDKNPSYGPLLKMNRIGKGGRIIKVYKLRTMHPFAEYLQEYVYKNNNLDSGGKFKNDFRVTVWGKFLRKFWLDELPMLINLLRGELKLIGVRPLSPHYLSLYRPDLSVRRMNYKPGLIPPYYADLPKTLDEIQDSEEKYLNAFDEKPVRTDLIYFFKSVYNICFKKARSK